MGKGGDLSLPSIPKRAQLSLTTTQPHPFGQAGVAADGAGPGAAMAPLPQLVSKRLGRPKQRAARPRSRSRQVSLPAAPPQPLGLGGLAITGTAPVVTGSRALNPHAWSGKRAAAESPAPPVADEAGSTIQLRLKSWGEAPLFETVSDADSDAQGTVAVQIKPAPKADGLQFVAAPTAANSPKKKTEDGRKDIAENEGRIKEIREEPDEQNEEARKRQKILDKLAAVNREKQEEQGNVKRFARELDQVEDDLERYKDDEQQHKANVQRLQGSLREATGELNYLR